MMRRISDHTLHVLQEILLAGFALFALAAGGLIWRLHQGPLDITALVRAAQSHVLPPGLSLRVGQAGLAWEGFSSGGSPLDIRWQDLVLVQADGTALARLPRGRVSLDVPSLALGRFVPRLVQLEDADLRLERAAGGATSLALGDTPQAGDGGKRLLRALGGSAPADDPLSILGKLRHLGVHNATLQFHDAASGVALRARLVSAVLTRGPGRNPPGLDGAPAPGPDGQPHAPGAQDLWGHAQLELQIGGQTANLTASGTLGPEGAQAVLGTTPVVPYGLALTAPILAPLAALDAPASLAGAIRLGPDLTLAEANLSLQAGEGRINTGRGVAPIAHASLQARLTPTRLEIPSIELAFHRPPGATAEPPVLHGHASAEVRADSWDGSFTLSLNQADFADLPYYWPYGTGGGTRAWIVSNITAGQAHDAHVAGQLHLGPAGAVTLTHLEGGLAADGLTLTWLAPIAPLTNGQARLILEGQDALRIEVPHASQGALNLSDGLVRISGLRAEDQSADISFAMQGGLAETLSLLAHPRLALLNRHPLDVTAPSGKVAGKLHISLPLRDSVPIEEIGINATASLADVNLGHVVVGRDLEHGQLSLTATSQALHIDGTGELAHVPAQLSVAMDFRPGGLSQLVEEDHAEGLASPEALQAAGLPEGLMRAGRAALRVRYSRRRDGLANVAMAADLTPAAIETELGWHKEVGEKAGAEARLVLQDGQVVGFDQIAAHGPNLTITSHADMQGGLPRVLHLDQIRIDRTEAAGSIALATAKAPMHISLAGKVLDLSGYFARRDHPPGNAPQAEDETPGPPWQAELQFGQVVLARDEVLAPASLNAQSDGRHITRMLVSAGRQGEVRVEIKPEPGGRALVVDSADAGAVLLAGGVANNIRGGTLSLSGHYADGQPHAPLSGTATMRDFRVAGAPALARLLQAMTLYGTVDMLQGPGLGFRQAVLPFTWQQRRLQLQNARAFSASLGITAQGEIDLRRQQLDLTGTIVPAYFFNQLLGNIPLLGQIFSPEKGGGVFAASYSARGTLDAPSVAVNPLAALTPGILRGLFNLL